MEKVIISKLNSESDLEILSGLELFSRSMIKSDIRYITPLLEHSSAKVTEEAVYCHGKAKNELAVPYLIEALNKSNNRRIKARAVSALGHYRLAKVESIYHELLLKKDLSIKVKRRLFENLHSFPSKIVQNRLIEILNHPLSYEEVLFEIVDALYLIRSNDLLSELIKLNERYSVGYLSIVLKKMILEINFHNGAIESPDEILTENLDEVEVTINIWKYCLDLSDNKGEFLSNEICRHKFANKFSFGSVSMEAFASLSLVEKGSIQTIEYFKALIAKNWDNDSIESFEFMMDATSELYAKYFTIDS